MVEVILRTVSTDPEGYAVVGLWPSVRTGIVRHGRR
jgi:hypothetical protein